LADLGLRTGFHSAGSRGVDAPTQSISPQLPILNNDLSLPEAQDPQHDLATDPAGEEPVEGRAPSCSKSPYDPTQAEVDEHRLMGHVVFRSWCPSCVRGRGREGRHAAVHHEDSEIPVISFDYCYLSSRGCARDQPEGDGDHEQQNPVLVMWDSKSKGLYGHVVFAKGVDNPMTDRAVSLIVDDLNSTGYKRAVIRSDNEPAITALLRLVARRWMGEVVPESSAEGDPQSNGAAENAVRIMKGLVRSAKDALETRIGRPLPSDHGLITWIVPYVAAMYRRCAIGIDGRTPSERLTGRRFGGRVAEFGEKIWWMPLQTNASQLPPLGARFESGWYLGPLAGSALHQILTATGAVKSRTVRRRPPSERWGDDILETGKATEMQPNAFQPGEVRLGIRAPVHRAVPSSVPPPPNEDGQNVQQGGPDFCGQTLLRMV